MVFSLLSQTTICSLRKTFMIRFTFSSFSSSYHPISYHFLTNNPVKCQNLKRPLCWKTQNPFFVSRRLQFQLAISRSANQMRLILALGQSGVNNFARVRKKNEKKRNKLNHFKFRSDCFKPVLFRYYLQVVYSCPISDSYKAVVSYMLCHFTGNKSNPKAKKSWLNISLKSVQGVQTDEVQCWVLHPYNYNELTSVFYAPLIEDKLPHDIVEVLWIHKRQASGSTTNSNNVMTTFATNKSSDA